MTNDLHVTETELKPVYNNQKSYNGRAYVYDCIFTNRKTGEIVAWWRILKSYETYVCAINMRDDKFYRLWDWYSATTQKHIHDFRLQNGLSGMGKKKWEKLETWNLHNVAAFESVYAN